MTDRLGAALQRIFAEADAEGFLHVRALDGDPGEVSFGADTPVVLASVFKIAVALEYARQAAAGTLDRTQRHTVTRAHRSGGGAGSDGCQDDVELSLRDAAFLMMSASDNAATDLLLERVGARNVRDTVAGLGFTRFRLGGSCREGAAEVERELGTDPAQASEDRIRALAYLDPAHGRAGTPREITALLAAIWRDEAGPAEACAEVRELMSRQFQSHRLESGFPPQVRVAAKNGTHWGIRNEAGVVEYPDGHRYAVAVFLRTRSLAERLPAADAAIGRSARTAIDHLTGPLATFSAGGVVSKGDQGSRRQVHRAPRGTGRRGEAEAGEEAAAMNLGSLTDLTANLTPDQRDRIEVIKVRMIDSERGHELAALRKTQGMTQVQVAAAMGVSQGRISQIERGAQQLDTATMSAYLEAIGGRLTILATVGNVSVQL
ncbi:serine hydrolase [Streptacidiphilus carbonis]|uniref:serine hydrolase n=1 Tax=Streptacidiphilus carbonis TaxID=105422 RepID=UPI0007C6B94B